LVETCIKIPHAKERDKKKELCVQKKINEPLSRRKRGNPRSRKFQSGKKGKRYSWRKIKGRSERAKLGLIQTESPGQTTCENRARSNAEPEITEDNKGGLGFYEKTDLGDPRVKERARRQDGQKNERIQVGGVEVNPTARIGLGIKSAPSMGNATP